MQISVYDGLKRYQVSNSSLLIRNVYTVLQHVLFGTVDELKFVGSFKRCLNTSVFPQLLRVLIELLQCTQDEPHY